MEIPITAVVASYREKLSDVIHQLTLKELHIKELESILAKKRETITDLQTKLDIYEIAEQERNNPTPDDEWENTDGDSIDSGN
jgi:hypothetical protein